MKEVWAKKSHEEKRIIQQHQQDAIKEKYGVENVFAASWCKEKIKQTNIEKYGENYKSVFAKKQLETIEKKHGKKGSSSYKEYYRDIRAKGIQKTDYAKKQRKYEETCLKKYGVRNYSQTKMHKDDMKKFFSSKAYNVGGKIIFENICFDSSWELQLFLFLRDFKIEFIFHPKKIFFIQRQKWKSTSIFSRFSNRRKFLRDQRKPIF